jgi:PAS domain S-box-containing protein
MSLSRLHEDYYLLLLRHGIADPLVGTDAEGRVRFMTPAAEQLTGWTMDEATGQPLAIVLPIQGDPPVLRSRHGIALPMEQAVSSIVDGAGKVVGTVVSLKDPGARSELSRALLDEAREARTRLESVLEGIHEAFISVDRDGRVIYANARAHALLSDVSPFHRFEGHALDDVLPGTRGSELESACIRARESGVAESFEYACPALAAWLDIRIDPHPGGLSIYLQDVTRSKQIHQQLSNWQQILARSTWPIALSNEDISRVADCSEAYCAMHGYSREEVLDRPIADLFAPESRERLRDEFALLQRSGSHVFEAIRLRKDGSRFPAVMHLTSCYDDDGNVTQRAVFVVDISELKRVERDLEAQRNLLENLNEASRILLEELDLARIVRCVTESARVLCDAEAVAFFYRAVPLDDETALGEKAHGFAWAVTGLPREVFEGLPTPHRSALFAATLQDAGPRRLDDALAEGRTMPHFGVRSYLAVPVVAPSGKVLGGLILGHAEPARFTQRHEDALVLLAAQAAVAMDNARLFESLQRERQRALQGERESRLLAETIPHLVWTTNPEGSAVWHNQRWYDYSGLASGHGVEDASREVVHPDDLATMLAAWRASVASEGEVPYAVEYRIRSREGEYRWFLDRGYPLRDAEGRVVRWFGSCTDIEDQKRAQAILERSQDELERKVAERTRALELANSQLKDLDRLKSEFLASISHELRTPLNSIIGFTDLMLSGLTGDVTEEQRRQLGMVHSAGHHLLALINDLLDLSRIEAGRMDLAPQEADLASVVHDVVDIVRPLVEEKRLALTVAGCRPGETVVTDVKKLKQVLLNLLSNAIKFTASGSIAITCETRPDACSIAVEDTGCGIDPTELGLLFEPFRQLRPSSYEGTGLGLFLCRRLMTLLQGEIEVESEVGRGSLFRIRFPRVVPARSAPP